MMDLVIAMVPYVDGQNIKKLYDLALPWLQVNTREWSVQCEHFELVLFV